MREGGTKFFGCSVENKLVRGGDTIWVGMQGDRIKGTGIRLFLSRMMLVPGLSQLSTGFRSKTCETADFGNHPQVSRRKTTIKRIELMYSSVLSLSMYVRQLQDPNTLDSSVLFSPMIEKLTVCTGVRFSKLSPLAVGCKTCRVESMYSSALSLSMYVCRFPPYSTIRLFTSCLGFGVWGQLPTPGRFS